MHMSRFLRAGTVTLLLPLVLACSGGGEAPDAPADSAAAAPTAADTVPTTTQRYPQFDNEKVEVWKTVIAPNQPLTMHRHDFPRVIVTLKGGSLKIVPEKGEPHVVTWETGKAYWLDADPPGEMHGDVNEGTEAMEVMVVQLKGTPGL